jgi:hypothetical protein
MAVRTIMRNEQVRHEMNLPWVNGQVDRQLQAMVYWVRNGYAFNEGQREQLTRLYDLVFPEED